MSDQPPIYQMNDPYAEALRLAAMQEAILQNIGGQKKDAAVQTDPLVFEGMGVEQVDGSQRIGHHAPLSTEEHAITAYQDFIRNQQEDSLPSTRFNKASLDSFLKNNYVTISEEQSSQALALLIVHEQHLEKEKAEENEKKSKIGGQETLDQAGRQELGDEGKKLVEEGQQPDSSGEEPKMNENGDQ